MSDFSLIPSDAPITEADDLEAAAASALEAAGDVLAAPDPPQPFGRTPKFDFAAGRMVRAGGAPVWVYGLEALAQWCMMCVFCARGAHLAVVSEDFGMEAPDSVLGQATDVMEAASDWGVRLEDALLAHDRVTAVENFDASYDPAAGILYINSVDVISDEERVSLGPLAIDVGGFSGG